MLFLSTLALTLSVAHAGNPFQAACDAAKAALAICVEFTAEVAPYAAIGCGIADAGVEIACLFAGENGAAKVALPDVHYRLKSGDIVAVPSDAMPPVFADVTPRRFQKRDVINPGPGYDPITITKETLEQAGQIAGSEHCDTVGQQKCLGDQNVFITCVSGNKWAASQACGSGTRCQPYPGNDHYILCGY